ncbi:MAG: putative phage abortive infection protein [Ignavibacteriae bacterium]|nr:putative phage abortive infection protein [Ignavibacteriota bacterium]
MFEKKKKQPSALFSYEGFSISLIWIGIIVILLIFIVFSLDIFVFNWISDAQDNKLGSLGQLLEGSVGTLWALAGVILYYEALRFQRMELKSQRHELELNRQEVIEQTQQLRAQNQTLFIQTFENTFFQLVTLHNDIVNNIAIEHYDVVSNTERKIAGRQCFFQFYNDFKYIFSNHIEIVGGTFPEKDDIQGTLNEAFLNFFNSHQEILGHYLRNVHNIIKYIDASDVKNKWFYTNLFHDHLSNYELCILLYYCISDIGIKLKPLAEKYSLLENIPVDEILDMRHREYLNSTAFRPMR